MPVAHRGAIERIIYDGTDYLSLYLGDQFLLSVKDESLFNLDGNNGKTISVGGNPDFVRFNGVNIPASDYGNILIDTDTATLVIGGGDFNFAGSTFVSIVPLRITPYKVTIDNLFLNCTSLLEIDMEKFSICNIRGAISAFDNCTSLKVIKNLQLLNISGSILRMFRRASALTEIDFGESLKSGFDSLTSICENCTNLKSLKFGNADFSALTSMYRMCINAVNLETVDFGNSLKNVTNLTECVEMFTNCTKLHTVTGFDIPMNSPPLDNPMGFTSAFKDAKSITENPITGLNDTVPVGNVAYMFSGCSKITDIYFTGDTRVCTDMTEFAFNCSRLTRVEFDIPTTVGARLMERMFSGCTSLMEAHLLNFATMGLTRVTDIFKGVPGYIYISRKSIFLANEDQCNYKGSANTSAIFIRPTTTIINISGNNTSQMTVKVTPLLDSPVDIEKPDFGSLDGKYKWEFQPNNPDTVTVDVPPGVNRIFVNGRVKFTNSGFKHVVFEQFGIGHSEDMKDYMKGCNDLEYLDASVISPSTPNTTLEYAFAMNKVCTTMKLDNLVNSNVVNCNWLCGNNYKVPSLDVSKWDLSSVTDIEFLFHDNFKLIDLDISKWVVNPNITSLYATFWQSPIQQLNMGCFKNLKLTNLSSTFGNSVKEIIGLNDLDVSRVTTFLNLFSNNTNLSEIDITNWRIQTDTILDGMFFNVTCPVKMSDRSVLNITEVETGYKGSADNGALFIRPSTIILDVSDVSNEGTSVYVRMHDFVGLNSLDRLYTYSVDGERFDISDPSANTFFGIDLGNGDKKIYFSGFVVLKESSYKHLIVEKWCNSAKNYNQTDIFSLSRSLTYIDARSVMPTAARYDISNMFKDNTSLETCLVNNLVTANCEEISSLFDGCRSLKNIDLSNWVPTGVKRAHRLFADCLVFDPSTVLTTPLTFTNITDVSGMFSKTATQFVPPPSLDLTNWSMSRNPMNFDNFMDYGRYLGVDMSSWLCDIASANYAFGNWAFHLTTLDIRLFKTSTALTANASTMFAGDRSPNIETIIVNNTIFQLTEAETGYNGTFERV